MLHTALTRRLGLRVPIIGAPMGGVSGAALCAAVSRGGGLGMIGAGYGDPDWLHRELAQLRATDPQHPWGVGLITWSSSDALVDRVLEARPDVVMLSFGDVSPLMPRLRRAGVTVLAQVQSVAAARAARDAGVDVIVAQGTEAGGHGARRATLPLVPAVVDAVAPLPVVAAGGIADGRGLAAVLMLGAQAALVGSRLYASDEALGHPRVKQQLVDRGGDDTVRTTVFDIVRELRWPNGFTGRALDNGFTRRWTGREAALRGALQTEQSRFRAAQDSGDADTAMAWAGECIDLVHGIEPAARIVQRMADEASACLGRAAAMAGLDGAAAAAAPAPCPLPPAG